MHKREADILQIKKYLNGELDAKAMHKLEKMAQDDPFLMDALEGYGTAGGDPQSNLNELVRRINLRTSRKKAAIVPLRYIGIAASVLIACSAGLLWFYRIQQPAIQPPAPTHQLPQKAVQKPTAFPAQRLAANEPSAVSAKDTKQPAHTEPKTIAAYRHHRAKISPVFTADTSGRQAEDDTATPVNEMIAMGYGTEKRHDTSGRLIAAKKLKIAEDHVLMKEIQGKAAGVSIADNANTSNSDKLTNLGYANRTAIRQVTAVRTLEGRVIGGGDKQPIPGASVKIDGTNTGAITDADGYFRLKADSGRHHLVVGYIGYQTRQVSANVPDTGKTIMLQPNSDALAEVVVTNYSAQPKMAGDEPEKTNVSAKPVVGWRSYHKYLDINAISPDNKKGVVKLSFMVDRYGSISRIKVEKSVSPETDQKAIDMIHAGPEWMGNSDNKPQKVTLRIRFPGTTNN